MKLDNAELAALYARATWASQGGFKLALSEVYVAALVEELGSDETSGLDVGSASHIAELAKATMALRASGGKKKAKLEAKKPEPPKVEVKPEAPKAEEPNADNVLVVDDVKAFRPDVPDTKADEVAEPVKAESKKPGKKAAKD